MTPDRLYLDANASAPLLPEARAALLAALEAGGNPSSIHAEGRAARGLIEDAREAVAGLAGAWARDVIFTSGASEAAECPLPQPNESIHDARRYGGMRRVAGIFVVLGFAASSRA